jgi:hypothetical protein
VAKKLAIFLVVIFIVVLSKFEHFFIVFLTEIYQDFIGCLVGWRREHSKDIFSATYRLKS